MAEMPTTRRGRWLYRKKKYAARMKRMRNSYPEQFEWHGYTALIRRFGPIEFNTDGSRQQSLWRLLKNPPNGYGAFIFPLAHTISAVSYKHPPHFSVIPPIEHHPCQNRDHCAVGFVNRPCMRLGHKNHRMHGNERAIYFANLSNLYHRLAHFPNAYPAWDPLHRTPIQEDGLEPFPAHPRWYHHVGPPFEP